jgi:hypothetical protein
MPKLNLKKIKRRAEENREREKERKKRQAEFDNNSAFLSKIPVGHLEIRILPPWSSDGLLSKELYTHFKLPPGDTTVPDVAKSWPKLGLDNPVTEVIEEFKDVLDVGRYWSKLTPKLNVFIPDSDINRDNEHLDEAHLGQVRIITPSSGTYNKIIGIIDNPRIGDITDPWDGVPLTIEKTTGAKWQDTRYTVNPLPERGPILEDEDEVEEILKKVFDLDKMFPAPDDAKIADVHAAAEALRKYLERQARSMGVSTRSSRRSRDSDEDKAEAKRKKTRKSLDEMLGDDDEEEAPKKKAKKKVKKKKKTTKKKVGKKKAKKSKTKEPECFADSDTYDEDSDTCLECKWEVPCRQELGLV